MYSGPPPMNSWEQRIEVQNAIDSYEGETRYRRARTAEYERRHASYDDEPLEPKRRWWRFWRHRRS